MSENNEVHLRPPKSPLAKNRLVRAVSRRSQIIQKMLERRESKDELVTRFNSLCISL